MNTLLKWAVARKIGLVSTFTSWPTQNSERDRTVERHTPDNHLEQGERVITFVF